MRSFDTRPGLRRLAPVALALALAGLVRAASAGPGTACPPIGNTPSFTLVYGTALLDGAGVPAGAAVAAVSPRGDVVGCFEVTDDGHYGAMYVFGEDPWVSPPVPGMRDGEVVMFRIAGADAIPSTILHWDHDREYHLIDLASRRACRYDFNRSGQVEGADLRDVAARWRNPTRYGWDYDADGDGRVDIKDVIPAAAAWGQVCP